MMSTICAIGGCAVIDVLWGMPSTSADRPSVGEFDFDFFVRFGFFCMYVLDRTISTDYLELRVGTYKGKGKRGLAADKFVNVM